MVKFSPKILTARKNKTVLIWKRFIPATNSNGWLLTFGLQLWILHWFSSSLTWKKKTKNRSKRIIITNNPLPQSEPKSRISSTSSSLLKTPYIISRKGDITKEKKNPHHFRFLLNLGSTLNKTKLKGSVNVRFHSSRKCPPCGITLYSPPSSWF